MFRIEEIQFVFLHYKFLSFAKALLKKFLQKNGPFFRYITQPPLKSRSIYTLPKRKKTNHVKLLQNQIRLGSIKKSDALSSFCGGSYLQKWRMK